MPPSVQTEFSDAFVCFARKLGEFAFSHWGFWDLCGRSAWQLMKPSWLARCRRARPNWTWR